MDKSEIMSETLAQARALEEIIDLMENSELGIKEWGYVVTSLFMALTEHLSFTEKEFERVWTAAFESIENDDMPPFIKFRKRKETTESPTGDLMKNSSQKIMAVLRRHKVNARAELNILLFLVVAVFTQMGVKPEVVLKEKDAIREYYGAFLKYRSSEKTDEEAKKEG